MDDLVGRLQKAIEVTPVQPMAETRASNLPGFFVNVTLDNPRNAQQVCTAVTSMFIEQSLSACASNTAEDTTQFLSQQLADAKAKLTSRTRRWRHSRCRYSGSLPDEEQTNLNLLTGLTSQLDAATQALARAQQDKGFAESHVDATGCGLAGSLRAATIPIRWSSSSGHCRLSWRAWRRDTRTTIRM